MTEVPLKIAITGGTGLVGSALARQLESKGHEVLVLSRSATTAVPGSNIKQIYWNPASGDIDWQPVCEADCIVHLAGTSVASGRWTSKRKALIRSSRLESSKLLYDTLASHPNRVRTVIAASAIGYYGSSEDHIYNESDSPATDFLGKTCVQWERSLKNLEHLNLRVVILRIGIVLSRTGGALPKIELPLRYGLEAIPGSGEQWTSWIHIDDLCRMVKKAIADSNWQGIYNAASPFPISQKQLILSIAKWMKKRFYLRMHVPAILLKVVLGEMSTEILKSCQVSAEKALLQGFYFEYPTIGRAMEALYGFKTSRYNPAEKKPEVP